MMRYGLEHYNALESMYHYTVEPETSAIIDDVNSKIVPIVLEKQSPTDNKHDKHHKKSITSSLPAPRKPRQSSRPEDGSWERVREFKTTKIEMALSGPEKVIQDIRTCLNKMTTKNYDAQKDQILSLLKEHYNDVNSDVSQTIFDIASTNRFYVALYAKLYKELIANFPHFNELVNTFLGTFVGGVREIVYVDADEDYEEYCAYNKKNDKRKATAVFLIHLMKEDVISRLKVINIILTFEELAVKYVDETNRINEVEEIAEMLYLFFQEGKGLFQDMQTEWIWKFKVVPMIETFSKYKKNDKPSISSRAIFKFMDIMEMLK